MQSIWGFSAEIDQKLLLTAPWCFLVQNTVSCKDRCRYSLSPSERFVTVGIIFIGMRTSIAQAPLRSVPSLTQQWYSLQPFPRMACAVIAKCMLEPLKSRIPLFVSCLLFLGRIGWGYEDSCACCDLCGPSCSDNRN